MTEQEKSLVQTIVQACAEMSEEQRAYFLGFADGLVAAREQTKSK